MIKEKRLKLRTYTEAYTISGLVLFHSQKQRSTIVITVQVYIANGCGWWNDIGRLSLKIQSKANRDRRRCRWKANYWIYSKRFSYSSTDKKKKVSFISIFLLSIGTSQLTPNKNFMWSDDATKQRLSAKTPSNKRDMNVEKLLAAGEAYTNIDATHLVPLKFVRLPSATICPFVNKNACTIRRIRFQKVLHILILFWLMKEVLAVR